MLYLRRKYNLPLKDESISNRSKPVWKSVVKRQIRYHVFSCLLEGATVTEKQLIRGITNPNQWITSQNLIPQWQEFWLKLDLNV